VKRLEKSEYALMRSRNMRIVVTKLPKNEGPPISARQPRRTGAGAATFFPFGFFGDAAAIPKEYTEKCPIFLFFAILVL
jgi:hypothetical protein